MISVFEGRTKVAIGTTREDIHTAKTVKFKIQKLVGGTGLIKGKSFGLFDGSGRRNNMVLQKTYNGTANMELIFKYKK